MVFILDFKDVCASNIGIQNFPILYEALSIKIKQMNKYQNLVGPNFVEMLIIMRKNITGILFLIFIHSL